MALGEHLRSDQDVDLLALDLLPHRGERIFRARRVAIHPNHAGLRERIPDRLLQSLGSEPEREQIDVPAFGTRTRHRLHLPAVMTAQSIRMAMDDESRRAALAFAFPRAGRAFERWRESTPVDENERLLVASEPACKRVPQRTGKAVAPICAPDRNEADRRLAGTRVGALRQHGATIATAACTQPGLECCSGRAGFEESVKNCG